MSAPDWPWFCYWLLVFGGIAFGVAETWAIKTKRRGATLSANVNLVTRRVPFGAHLLALFMAWLYLHFTVGGGHRWDVWEQAFWRHPHPPAGSTATEALRPPTDTSREGE